MGSGAVPIPSHRLGREVGRDVEVLGGPIQQPAGHPNLIGQLDGWKGTDLELPLTDHHLGVGPGNGQAGVDAVLGMRLDDIPSPDLVGTNTAVIPALGGGKAAGGPPVGPAIAEEGVLLLDTEDRLVVLVLLERLNAGRPGVGPVWLHLGVEDLAHDEDVVAPPNRIGLHQDRSQHTIRIITGRLLGAGTVEGPDRWLFPAGNDLGL